MKQLVEGFAQQLRDAIDIGEKATVTFSGPKYNNVVIAGLGGSGIGGNLIQSYVADKLSAPVVVTKGYTVPSFVGPDTLFIASSFSGNTEETLAAVRAAMRRDASVCFVTSGGEMLRLAKKNNMPFIIIPDEAQPPRACLGYSVVLMLYLLHHAELLDDTFKTEIRQSINLLEELSGSIKVQASALANALQNKLPVLYVSDTMKPVALRFQQQINLNAKQQSHVNVFPEASHSEVEGWQHPGSLFGSLMVLLIRTNYDHPRVRLHMDVTKKIFEGKVQDVLEMEARGATFLEQTFHLIHMFDWVTVYLAELNNVDPNTIDNINYLKGELSKE